MAARRKRKGGRPQGRDTEGWWLIFIAIACFFFSALSLVAKVDDAASMNARTEGWVLHAQERSAGKGHKCSVDYEYSVDGQTYRIQTEWSGGCGDIRPNGPSTVYYSSEDPERSKLQDPMDWKELYLGSIVLFGAGALSTVPAAHPALEKIRILRRKR